MKIYFLLLILLSLTISCKKDNPVPAEEKPVQVSEYVYYQPDEFAMGVDLSYVNQVEDHGGTYRDSAQIRDPYRIMKEHGANFIRVRLWHNPTWVRDVYGGGNIPLYSGLADVEKTIQRAKDWGMAVNLDFHYSDTWADPGNQIPPKAWQDITDLQVLKDSVYNYTFSVLSKLNAAGLMPEMIQIGNETNCGMMMTETKAGFPNLNACDGHWQELGAVINSGIKAVRDVEANSTVKTKVALHVADPKNLDWWFGNIIAAGEVTDFDILGMSYYPLWHTTISFNDLPPLITQLKNAYLRKVMILETAYPWTAGGSDSYNNLFGGQTPLTGYPFTPAGQSQFLIDLTQKVMNAGGSGIMYWEPAWISSQMKDPWGTGSSWENCTFFDFNGNTLPAIDFMRQPYTN